MADLIIVYWRDIPAQVIVGKGRRGAKVQLSERFEQAIDRCAMKIGAKDADAYLARLEAFPVSMDGELERQKADAAKGVFAPDYILDTTMKMQAALRDQPAAQTVLVASFAKKLAAAGLPPERAAQAEKIVAEKVFPAVDRQRALVQQLRAKAVHDAGCWRLPDGEAFYAAAAEAATTTRLTGDEIHQMGLDQVASISSRIDAILKGEPIDVYGEGRMSRDFTYVDDIVTGVVAALDRPAAIDPAWDATAPNPATSGVAPWRILNLGAGRPVPLMRYIEVLETKLGRKAKLNLMPMQDGDVADTEADVTDTLAALDYAPTTPVEEGVARFVDWYCNFYREN